MLNILYKKVKVPNNFRYIFFLGGGVLVSVEINKTTETIQDMVFILNY